MSLPENSGRNLRELIRKELDFYGLDCELSHTMVYANLPRPVLASDVRLRGTPIPSSAFATAPTAVPLTNLWPCSQCGFRTNYSNRVVCYKCSAPKDPTIRIPSEPDYIPFRM